MWDTAVLNIQRPIVPRDTAVLDGQRPSEDDSHGDTISEQRHKENDSQGGTVSEQIPRESTSDDYRLPLATNRHTQARSQCDPDDIVALQSGQREVVDLLGSDDVDNRFVKSEDCDTDAERFSKYSGKTN